MGLIDDFRAITRATFARVPLAMRPRLTYAAGKEPWSNMIQSNIAGGELRLEKHVQFVLDNLGTQDLKADGGLYVVRATGTRVVFP